MARSTHDKQLARARDKRRQDALTRRRTRSRVVALTVVGLLVLSLIGVALVAGLDDGDETPVVEPPDEDTDGGDAADPDAEPPAGEDETPATDDGASPDDPDTGAGEAAPCPEPAGDVPEVDSQRYDAPPELTIDTDAAYTATIATTCGDILVELDAASAPLAVNNFVFLAEEGYYDGVEFHRVVEGFVAQAGDPAGTGCGREDCTPAGAEEPAYPGYTFEDELEGAQELVAEEGGYPQGTLAMANAGPDTNGSQWFIVEPDGGVDLPPDYTVFGHVVEGQAVVNAIVRVPVEGERPVDPVRITSVTVEAS